MAKSKNSICGGFVALNTGEIVDCFSNITVSGKATMAGFCGNNIGVIKNSFCAGHVNKAKVSGGFWAKNSGTITDCFYIKNKSESKKSLDTGLGKLKKELTFEKTYNNFNWDFDKIWDCSQNTTKEIKGKQEPFLPTFIKEKFYFELPESEDVIEISTVEELFNIAAKINDGDKKYASSRYILNNNIDIKNKKWIPIGIDENSPFTGTFDGGGYSILNLKVDDKEFEFSGFFWLVKNATIINLGIECVIKNGRYSGALAGVNEGSQINCCFAACEINSDKFPGGLVGKNAGKISHCFVIGKVKNGIFMLLPFFLGSGTLATISTAVIITNHLTATSVPTYPKIPIDEGASQISGEKIAPNPDVNQVSFQFDKQIAFDNANSGGVFKFVNPGDSNHIIVVELQLTDQEIINTLGSTCRAPEEQTKVEKQQGYSPKTTRQVIARSGAIPVGYALDEIKLNPLSDGTVLKKGEYKAIIYLVFYDIKTNQRATLNSQLPVILKVLE